MKRQTGAREWSESSVNIQLGCTHNCRYCYARHLAVERFHRCTAEEWAKPRINADAAAKNYNRRQGTVMFPSSHDITPANINYCIETLLKLVWAGNCVLIVSKPHLSCIEKICGELGYYKGQILFRFTIGSADSAILKFWEPGAPDFAERFESLKYAFNTGFETSVSCEPYLDPYIVYTYIACKPYITDSFWIGKLRDFDRRVDLSGVTTEQLERFVRPCRAAQGDDVVRGIYRLLYDKPLVRWKDSVQKIINIQ